MRMFAQRAPQEFSTDRRGVLRSPTNTMIHTEAPSARSERRTCPCGGGCPACSAKAKGDVLPAVPGAVREVLDSPGEALDGTTRTFMETRFGQNLGEVRVHTDGRAQESAGLVPALAYTVGHDVVFGARQYDPQGQQGRKLLAHELTHVLQQRRGGGSLVGHAEQEARAAMARVGARARARRRIFSGAGRVAACIAEAGEIFLGPIVRV